MIQQTQTIQNHENKTVHKASHSLAHSFVGLLRFFWGIIRKVSANIMYGFHVFVEAAEQRGPSYNENWWDSPETVDDLMKR